MLFTKHLLVLFASLCLADLSLTLPSNHETSTSHWAEYENEYAGDADQFENNVQDYAVADTFYFLPGHDSEVFPGNRQVQFHDPQVETENWSPVYYAIFNYQNGQQYNNYIDYANTLVNPATDFPSAFRERQAQRKRNWDLGKYRNNPGRFAIDEHNDKTCLEAMDWLRTIDGNHGAILMKSEGKILFNQQLSFSNVKDRWRRNENGGERMAVLYRDRLTQFWHFEPHPTRDEIFYM